MKKRTKAKLGISIMAFLLIVTGCTGLSDAADLVEDTAGRFFDRSEKYAEGEAVSVKPAQEQSDPLTISTKDQTIGYGNSLAVKDLVEISGGSGLHPRLIISSVIPEGAVVSESGAMATFPQPGNYEVTISGSDRDNVISETASVTVIDDTAPDLEFESGQFYLSELDMAFDFLPGIKAFDEIDGDLTDKILYSDEQVQYGVPGQYSVLFSVEDASENKTEIEIPVIIIDRTPPVITMETESFTLTDKDTEWDFLSGVQAEDAIDGDLTESVIYDDSQIAYTIPGEYMVVYLTADQAGNFGKLERPVLIKDVTAPELLLAVSEIELTEKDRTAPYLEGASASDSVDGDLTDQIRVNDKKVKYGLPGEYKATCSVEDAAGNKTKQKILVKISDVTAPSLILLKNSITLKDTDKKANFRAYVSAYDSVDGNLTDKIKVSRKKVKYGRPGTYQATYSVTDQAGNKTKKKIDVIIKDVTPPTITLPSESISLKDSDKSADYKKGVRAYDGVEGDLTNKIKVKDSKVKYGKPGNYKVRFTVSDSAGNKASKTMEVNVKDTTNPVIKLSQSTFSLEIGESKPNYKYYASASDSFDGDISSSITVDDSGVNYSRSGSYSVYFSAADKAGNRGTASASVNILSNEHWYVLNKNTKKIHYDGCRALSTMKSYNKREVYTTYDSLIRQGYTPCAICNPR